jgi:serine/threonine protein kinase
MTDPSSAVARVLADRFEIEALVGRGGMGEVFRARDLALGETVAVKVLRLDVRDVVGALARFKKEVRLARRVTHKNVARVFDIVEAGDVLLLTMELVDGETLADLLERERTLPLETAVHIALDVCAGLAAVHAAGVIHRDLKPSNVLLERPREDTDESRVVLTDFGVAHSTLEAASMGAVIVGTPRYMAPEQARGMSVDARADLYSLGVMLEEMTNDDDERYADLVRRCLSPEVGERPASAMEARAALDEMATRPSLLPRTSRTDATIAGTPRARTQRSIVVLPFRVATDDTSTDAALGGVIAQELTDVLCTIRELRVVASTAAAQFADERDPERVRRALAVDALIDGTIQIRAERVRITARLIDAASGEQLWREHFEGSLSSLFSFENTIAKRVAEHLRLRVTVIAFDEGVPPEAVRLYLDASAIKEGPMRTEEALALLERAIAIHPRFAPALSALALRSLTAWYVPFTFTPPDWGQTCASRVQRALLGAPSLAETHVAAAILRLEQGAVREAELALRRALQVAPTCVDALTALADLECNAGRTASGVAHARLAVDLDPGSVLSAVTLAREEAFEGRLDSCLALLDALGDEAWSPPPFLLRVRAAAWNARPDIVRAWLGRGAGMSDASGQFPYGEIVARTIIGESSRDEMEMIVDGLLAVGKSPRFCAEVLRVATEMSIMSGRPNDALERLDALGALDAFFDVDWLERCPALRPLSTEPAFARALASARRRANAPR